MDIESLIEITKSVDLLYVEDEEKTREIALKIFETLFNKVYTATSGKEALEIFKNKSIDLVITDVNIPDMNGIEFSKKIREFSDVPIIIVSALNESEYFLRGIEIGINSYILKPVSLEKIFNAIKSIEKTLKYKKELQRYINLIRSYEQAVNELAIVSKGDTKGKITFINDKFSEISGYSKDELIGKPHSTVRHPDVPKEVFENMWNTIQNKKIWRGILRNRKKDGSSYYVDSVIVPVLDENGEIREYISIRHDITDVMNPLNQLKEEIKTAKNAGLLLIRLKNFSILEEIYEYSILSEIQNKSAEYLEKIFREFLYFDKLYNLNHGEYALIFECQNHLDVINKIKQALEIIKINEIKISDFDYYIEILASVVFHDKNKLESAQIGLKKLIDSQKEIIVADGFFEEKKELAKKNLQTIKLIKDAVNEEKVVSFFQPIVQNSSKQIVKYESLVRIKEKDKIISPFFFLDIAKKSGYYLKITEIVLEKSFSVLEKTDKEISINLSALDITYPILRRKIFSLLKEYGGKRVTFELLEDEKIHNYEELMRFIKAVKEYGVKIAIDDFGSGYSNYMRLLDYQPDILKIDGSIIKNLDKPYSMSILKSIINFAKEQNLQTVAEFVENEEIYKQLLNLGVDFSQGYYFGKPEENII